MLQKIKFLKKYLFISIVCWTLLFIYLQFLIVKSAQHSTDLNQKLAIELMLKTILVFKDNSENGNEEIYLAKNSPEIIDLLEQDILPVFKNTSLFKNEDKIRAKLIFWNAADDSDLNFLKSIINQNETDIIRLLENQPNQYVLLHTSKEHTELLTIAIYLNNIKQCNVCVFYTKIYKNPVQGILLLSIQNSSFHKAAYMHVEDMNLSFFFIWLIGVSIFIWIYYKSKKIVGKELAAYKESIFNLVNILEQRDSYTAGHTNRVTEFALLIANEMNLPETKKELLYRASMLHDIGKISTPDSVLLKPGKLSKSEFKIIQKHSIVGFDILIKVNMFKDIAHIVRSHHEKFDGCGYPDALIGEKIPFISQILTVADSFDAMTTNRIYKPRLTVKQAIEELKFCSGSHFNPEIIDSAIQILSTVTINDNITQLPISEIDHQRFAFYFRDVVTDAFNKNYLVFLLSNTILQNNFNYLLIVKIVNLDRYNKQLGWQHGDDKLSEISKDFIALKQSAMTFRIFGNKFIILLDEQISNNKLNSIMKKHTESTSLNWEHRYINLTTNFIKKLNDIEHFSQRMNNANE